MTPPARRPNTLQSKVAKLRRALGDPDTIVNVDGGYRLAVEPNQVDAHVALEAAGAARRLLDEAEERQVIELCAATLARFTGELLISAGHGSWVEPHRARLEAAPAPAAGDVVRGQAAGGRVGRGDSRSRTGPR